MLFAAYNVIVRRQGVVHHSLRPAESVLLGAFVGLSCVDELTTCLVIFRVTVSGRDGATDARAHAGALHTRRNRRQVSLLSSISSNVA
jgi:hypothetical protein